MNYLYKPQKWVTWLLGVVALALVVMSPTRTWGQVSGTKTLPGDYATLAAFVTDINANGIGAGGVTLNIASAYTETAPAGGYVITATGTAANPIVIQRASGSNPVFTANGALVAGTFSDGIIKIHGGDYITLRSLTLQENAANLTTTAASNNMTEWGVAVLYATATDGAQNVTIDNCTITLNRTYQNTWGIYSNSTHGNATPTSAATATGALGGNHNLTIIRNAISNVNNGIAVVGPTAAADNNDGLVIGGSLANANTITNYGTTGTFSSYTNVSGSVNGILIRNTKNYSVTHNTITSSVGGVTVSTTLRGVYIPAFSNAPTGTITNTVNNNAVSIQAGVAAATLQGIVVESTTGNATTSLSISNNDFNTWGHTVTGSGAITFISNAMATLSLTASNNTFTNLTVNTTGSVTFVNHGYTMPAGGSQTFNNNSIVGSFTKTGAGGSIIFFTSGSSSPNGSSHVVTNNNFSNIIVSGATAITGISNTDGSGTSPNRTVTGNTFSNWTGGTSAIVGMNYAYIGATTSISNNTVTNITGQAAVTGVNIGSSFSGGNPLNVANNTINNLSSTGTGGTVIGIASSNTSAIINVNGNSIHTLSSTASTVSGLSFTGATLNNIFNNKIYNLLSTSASAGVNGINVTSGTTFNINNNLIGDLRATAATGLDAVRGINASATSNYNVYFNTIYLNASSSSITTFGTSCITFSSTTTAILDLRNNILINRSTPGSEGTNVATNGISACLRRSSGTAATVPSNYSTSSNNNIFFADPSSGLNNHLTYVEGTGTVTNPMNTFAQMKTFMVNRDQLSAEEMVVFTSTASSNANYLRPTSGSTSAAESGGQAIGGITVDYAGTTRTSPPDIGAYEFAGISLISCFAPGTLTTSALAATTVTLNWVAPGTAPSNGYEWEVRTSGAAGSGATGLLTSGSVGAGVVTANVTGLAAQTTYTYYVRSNCGGAGFSTWAASSAFTTPCLSATIPYTETFESATVPALPSCVTGNVVTRLTTATGAAPQGGTQYINVRWTPTVAKYLYSAPLAFTSGTSYDMAIGYLTDAITGWQFLRIYANTTPSITGATQIAQVSNIVNTTYSTLSGTYVAPSTGAYYMIVEVIHNGTPNDMSLDNMSVTLTPSCVAPTALLAPSPLAATTATLNWTASTSNPSSGYQWEVRTSGLGGSGATGLVANGSVGAGVVTANVTGLTAQTAYTYYVRGNCGAGDFSPWTASSSFTTPCASVSTFPWTEGFEGLTAVNTTTLGAQPACWGLVGDIGAANGPQSLGRSARTGSRYAYVQWSTTAVTGDWMFTPPFALTAGTSYDFSFWYKTDGVAGWDTLRVAVGNAATTGAMTTRLGTRLNGPTNTTYQEYKVSYTPASTGTYHFGVNIWATSSPDYTSFDDFSLQLTPACVAPTALLTPSPMTATTATLNWTASASASSGYEWEVRTSGLGGSGATGLVANSNVAAGVVTANVTGLTAQTTYTYYVRSNCGGAGFSTWTASSSFTTPCVAVNVPYTQDFSSVTAPALPSCTSIQNVGTGNNWVTSATTPSATGFTGNVLRYSYNSTNNANVWFFTQGINLTAGTQYKIAYKYANSGGTTFPEKLKVSYGSSASAAAMTSLLGDHPNVVNTAAITNTVAFTPASTGVYFFGFNAYSDLDEDNLYVDDISINPVPALDMSANALASPSATGCYAANESVIITVKNEGSATINFATSNVTVVATATSPSAVVTNFNPVVLSTGTLAAGATQNVTVSTTYNMTAAGAYTFNAATSVSGDGLSTNDAMSAATRTVEAIQAAPYSQNFETSPFTGWTGIATSFGVATNASCLPNSALYAEATSTASDFQAFAPRTGVLNTNSAVRFKYALTSGAGCTALTIGTNTITVEGSLDCGATYVPMYTINSGNHTNANSLAERVVRLDAVPALVSAGFTGKTLKVRFKSTWTTGTVRFWVDDYEVYTDVATDVQAQLLVSPTLSIASAASQTVTVRVRNNGSNAINLVSTPVTVTASGTSPSAAVTNFTPIVLNTGTLASGATQDVVVATANYDMSAAGTYIFNASASVTGDNNTANDAMSATNVNAYAPFKYDITVDSTNFTSIMSSGSAISGWAQSGTFVISDEAWSGALDLSSYNFKHQGVKVNGLRVNTNGFLTFETQFVSGSFFTPTTQLATISSFENRRIAPFWSDMVLTGSTGDAALLASTSSPIKYQISGAPGSRVLTVEWAGMEKFANAGPDMNFQTKFYEASEKIEFVYGTMKGFDGATNTSWGYVTGLSGSLSGNVIAQGSANIANFTATATTSNALQWVPKCNSRITFVPNAAAVLPTATLSAPSYDEKATAKVVVVGSGVSVDNCQVFRTAGATASNPTFLGTNGGSTTASDVWFRFTTAAITNNKISVLGGYNFNGNIHLLKDTTGGSMKQIGFINNFGSGLTDTLRTNNLPAGTYYVRIYDTGTTSAGVFNLSVYSVVAPPANDNCTGAIALTVGGATLSPVASGNTANATQSSVGCSGTADDDVWYSFTTTNTNPVLVQVTGGAGYNAVMQIYTGTCAALVSSACINATATGGTEVSAPITVAGTYYVRVYHSVSGATPTTGFTIGVYSPVPNCATLSSPNDGANIIVAANVNNLTWTAPSGTIAPTSYDVQVSTSSLFGSFVVNTNVVAPGLSYAIPASTLSESTTYYWRVVAKNANGSAVSCATRNFSTTGTVPSAATGLVPANATTNVALNQVLSWTAGSGFPTGYDVYFGTNQAAVAARQAGVLVVNNQFVTTYTPTLAGNTTYYWMVVPRNANGPATTTSVLSFTTTLLPPTNDNCSGARALTIDAAVIAGTTAGATASVAGAGCAGNADDDVWYSFVATNVLTHRITVKGNGTFDPVVGVLAGSSCGALGGLQCANATGAAGEEVIELSGLTNGATYYVLVYSNGGAGSQGTFTVQVNAVSCAPVTALTTAAVGATIVDVTWTPSPTNSLGYEIQWRTGTNPWNGPGRLPASSSAYRIPSLIPNTLYTYRFRSVCNAGVGLWVSKTVTTLSVPSCSAPVPSVSSVGASVADISWTVAGGTSGISSYEVQWQTVGGLWNGSGKLSTPSLTAYRIPSLTPGVMYNYRVRSLCSSLNEWTDWSNGSFTTNAVFTCSTPTFVLDSIGATAVDVSWTPTSNTSAYEIQWQTVGGAWNGPGRFNNPMMSAYRIPSLLSGTTYNYRMRSLCTANNEWSSWTTSTFTTNASAVCSSPSGISVTQGASFADLSWTPTTATSAYEIQWQTAGGAWNGPSRFNNALLSAYRIPNLAPSTLYNYRIRSLCVAMNEWASWTTGTFTTLAGGGRLASIGSILNVSVYPNPTSGQANVAFEVTEATKVSYVVYNTLGQAVTSGDESIDGMKPLELNLSAYPQGTYMLKVVANNQVFNRSIVLTK